MLKRPAIDVMAEYKAFPRRPKREPLGQDWIEGYSEVEKLRTDRRILNAVLRKAQTKNKSREGS
jgi:hypothetical protein